MKKIVAFLCTLLCILGLAACGESEADLAKKAEVGQLMLTHFSARFKDIKPLVEEAKSIFPNTIAATDLAVVEVLSQTPVLSPI